MFYENLRLSKIRQFPLRQGGVVLLSCSLLVGCTNPSLTTESSSLATPTTATTQSAVGSGAAPGTIPSPSVSPRITPSISPINPVTNPATNPLGLPSSLSQMPAQPQLRQGQQLPITARVTINSQVIDLEVANTPQEQEIGLMFRTDLSPNRGMLFPFQPARSVAFWMKNTLIPLDMIFLHQGVIRYVATQVPPCKVDSCPSYGPAFNVDVDQVIELRSGRAGELGLRVGDPLTLEFLP